MIRCKKFSIFNFQFLTEFLCGAGSVTNLVLDVGAQFGKGLVVAVGTEDGVVAEALCPTPLAGDLAIDNAFK